jgi:hypothetical protein
MTTEEKICRIIRSHEFNQFEEMAKEIASLFEGMYTKEFVEWSAFIYYDEIRWWVTRQEGMTTEELYEYYKSVK